MDKKCKEEIKTEDGIFSEAGGFAVGSLITSLIPLLMSGKTDLSLEQRIFRLETILMEKKK